MKRYNQPSCVYFVLISLPCVLLSRSSCFSENVNNVGGFCVIKKKLGCAWVSFCFFFSPTGRWDYKGDTDGQNSSFSLAHGNKSSAMIGSWDEREGQGQNSDKKLLIRLLNIRSTLLCVSYKKWLLVLSSSPQSLHLESMNSDLKDPEIDKASISILNVTQWKTRRSILGSVLPTK